MSKNQPNITIVLPVYNGELTLKATIESLLNQTYTHFELLIGIDGTHDGSKTIAESFKDSRIKIFENPKNLGLANNVNSLIDKSSTESEYIAMAEQDDVYVPERLAWQVEVMEDHPEVALVSGIAEFIGDGGTQLFPGILVNKKSFPKGETLFTYLYINQLKVVNTCMLIRKQVHEDHHMIFRNNYGNFNVDWDYILRFSLISEIYGIPKILVKMNRTSTNPSVTTAKWQQFEASRQLLKDYKEEFPQLISKNDYKSALKMHRKIELGYRSKLGIIVYGIYYSIFYFDSYFIKYIKMRIKKYMFTNDLSLK